MESAVALSGFQLKYRVFPSWLQKGLEGEEPIHFGSRMIFSTVSFSSFCWAFNNETANSKTMQLVNFGITTFLESKYIEKPGKIREELLNGFAGIKTGVAWAAESVLLNSGAWFRVQRPFLFSLPAPYQI
jgi:hypothetical protein